MVFGVNVSGRLIADPGQLGVWVRPVSLAEVIHSSRDRVEQALRDEFEVRVVPMCDLVIAIKTREGAEKLLALFERLVKRPEEKGVRTAGNL